MIAELDRQLRRQATLEAAEFIRPRLVLMMALMFPVSLTPAQIADAVAVCVRTYQEMEAERNENSEK